VLFRVFNQFNEKLWNLSKLRWIDLKKVQRIVGYNL